ncbi:MAG: hypothetical protein E6J15_12330 [Chloroflexi bacterium]|nr:MAG: hypothetical protein E6J15_12330 [Chloroflexota bacterium]
MCDTRTVAVEREKVAPRGLEGVVATTTAISSVSDNFLQYRGYRIEELVGKAEYEEVAYLLLNGDLPNKEELRDFKAELTKHRTLSPFLREILRQMSESGTPMDVLRTVISASAVEDPGEGDNSHEAEYRKAIRLTAKLPTILATYIRRRRGEQPVTPDPTLGHAANFARMAGLDEAHSRAAEILNACFILQAEHGLNASTFAARITAATLAERRRSHRSTSSPASVTACTRPRTRARSSSGSSRRTLRRTGRDRSTSKSRRRSSRPSRRHGRACHRRRPRR